jgi:hypothetical protein
MLLNLAQLKKNFAKQGLVLPGDEPEEDPDRHLQLRNAYKDYVAEAASDDESDQSDASTKPSHESTEKKRRREGGKAAPVHQKKQNTAVFNDDDEEDDEDFECKLCDGGFALGDDISLMAPLELRWIESLETQPRNASLSVFVKKALRFYNNEIRPYSIERGHDYGEMTFKDMRKHLVRHVKTLALERLFQVEKARKTYMLCGKDHTDTRASDQCLKYMNHSYKLLKDKDKEEKLNKQMAMAAGSTR